MKRIVILGSTGSVGTQTLEVVRAHPAEFEVVGLSAHENTVLFDAQVREFRPRHVLQTAMSENPEQALAVMASTPDADLIVNAISGYAGLAATYAACVAGKVIALANKESLVMAGELIMKTAREKGAKILPIDSEPAALWQILGRTAADLPVDTTGQMSRAGPMHRAIKKVILTASGGPFWKWKPDELIKVSAEQAVRHPTWKMGEKISVDSATLMNKAFEIIETRWLFDVAPEQIDVVVHRQSVVHALVQFMDGNFSAILSAPDMRLPISYALFYPNSFVNPYPELDFAQLLLSFEKPDYSLFKGPKLAYDMLQAGGIMPAALCIADEIAVKKFLHCEISFLEIYGFIERALAKIKNETLSMDVLKELPQYFI